MVKKLFKHEFLSLLRLMLPIECAVLGAGILVRIIFLFEGKNELSESLKYSSIFIMVVALTAGTIAAIIFGVKRYYSNLFTVEGYLSFTLPVTPAQHIFVKAVTATVFEFIAGFIAIISFCIASAGDLLEEIVKLIAYLLKITFNEYKPIHLILFAVELLIFLVLTTVSRYLLFYCCITIGHLSQKRKVATAFGTFGLYVLVTNILSVIIEVVLMSVFSGTNFISQMYEFYEKNPYLCTHIGFVMSIAWYVVISAVYFLISNIIIKKKLNLE